MTRSLFVSLILLAGCASVKSPGTFASGDSGCVRKFVPDFTSQWYRSTIDVRGRHFSGLFLFKTMPDSSMRIVFTNEAGVTFFDYEFSRRGDFRVVDGIKPLRRRAVRKVLQKDLALVTMMKVRTSSPVVSAVGQSRVYSYGSGSDLDRITVNNDCSQLIGVERLDGDATKARVTFHGVNPDAPDSIFVSHVDFDMELRLRRLIKE